MRFISWNVNGLRAVMKKGFEEIFLNLDADFVCLQETKLQAGQIELEHREPLPAVDSDIREIQTLHTSFSRMQETLSGHVAKLLELQNQEMQSRMLALQAQMNPHFLFNSIQAIQAMADEGMDAEIAEMCQSMAGILRYVSSDSAQLVPLEKEIRQRISRILSAMMAYRPGFGESVFFFDREGKQIFPAAAVRGQL